MEMMTSRSFESSLSSPSPSPSSERESSCPVTRVIFWGGRLNHGDNDVKVVRKAIIIPTLIRVRVLPRDV
jgi:hypothetical protein